MVYTQPQVPRVLWLYVDAYGPNHVLSKTPHTLFNKQKGGSGVSKGQVEGLQVDIFNPICRNILASQLEVSRLEDLSKTKIISIDQVRLKCEANEYADALSLEKDILKVIAWNQAFRARSLSDFVYLSQLYEKTIQCLVKKDFFKKFYETKEVDLNRLKMYEMQFKTNCTRWPIVPSSFRQYQQIDRYQPTPHQRAPIINQRVQSKKKPVQCPPNCVCYAELAQGQIFCSYSLATGWQSQCPNRSRKLQCDHKDPQNAKKCRNSQIRKHDRKRCLGKLMTEGEQAEIQQRLTWGIDFYTRNIIFNSLPQFDIDYPVVKVPNEARRSYFIEHTLTRAFNFLGCQGYDLLKACEFIIQHSPSSFQSQEKSKQNGNSDHKMKSQIDSRPLFTYRDHFYASILKRNYEFPLEKQCFRVHTKGKGAICIDHKGIKQGSFIVEYFGELYQPWRWYDRQDVIKQILKKKKLKNLIPQFYNIYLEKHQDQPLGYDILVVDPSRKGNFSSRFSHSCDPNCGTVTTVSDGRYYIGMYAFKDIQYGQELTFDYCSMTESNYEHMNSICLCGKQKCRGNYLQLSTKKIYNNLMDDRNCFYSRNSVILKAAGNITQRDIKICADHNLKQGFLGGSPAWLVRWVASVLEKVEAQGQIYKNNLKEQWNRSYPWQAQIDPAVKQQKIELYSQISKDQIISIRTQNLITSVDKIKFFLSRNQGSKDAPIFIQNSSKTLQVLIFKQDSVLLELQQHLIKYKYQQLVQNIQMFLDQIKKHQSKQSKLFLFRLCCLVVSHCLLFRTESQFNAGLLSDVMYFYAFTHTYFSPNQYKAFQADQIVVAMSEITGERGAPNQKKQKSRKKYASPFVWGQIASWFKQTIVCPQASLSQDRRGTLSYPIIGSIVSSQYPYQKQNRAQFLKQLSEKPAGSWPPAQGCNLSFKNPYKLYGTMLFQSVHSRDILANHLPKQTLMQSCLDIINSPLQVKLNLFKKVQTLLSNTSEDSFLYGILKGLNLDYYTMVPVHQFTFNGNEARKRIKT